MDDNRVLSAEAAADERYMDLETLARYAGLSPRTLRRYMASRECPLPYRVQRTRGKRWRALVARDAFDAWMMQFHVPPLSQVDAEVYRERLARALAKSGSEVD